MHLQGNLQTVFDALFDMGVIDPVLKMDWKAAVAEKTRFAADIETAVRIANLFSHDVERLMDELGKLEWKTLEYLAMEVAREYADYHARKKLH